MHLWRSAGAQAMAMLGSISDVLSEIVAASRGDLLVGHLEPRLRPLWGDLPHRISHETALAMAPAPIKTGLWLDVSGPAVPSGQAEELKVRAHEEPDGDTLEVGARHLHGQTWMSGPARALLECLKAEDAVYGGDFAAARVLFWESVGSPEEVIGLAEVLGWQNPLRLLASLATRMNNCRVFWPAPNGLLPAGQRAYLGVAPAPRDSEWICFPPSHHDWAHPPTRPPYPQPPVFADEQYRVLWWVHPHQFLEDLLW